MGPQCFCIVLTPRTHEVARCPPALPTTKSQRWKVSRLADCYFCRCCSGSGVPGSIRSIRAPSIAVRVLR